MMQSYHSIKAYTRATHTVAKTRQVVMLYDGIIRFLKQAAEAMEANAIEERFLRLTKASDVIIGLQGSLDFNAGRSTAQVLYDFYSSLDTRIMNLHRRPDLAVCHQIIDEIKEMRDVWDGIDKAAESRDPVTHTDGDDLPPPSAPPSVKVSA